MAGLLTSKPPAFERNPAQYLDGSDECDGVGSAESCARGRWRVAHDSAAFGGLSSRIARGGGAGRRTGSDGAGLGLALVDEHVRMHGGRVWVEDRLGGESGARFVIELMAMELDE